MSSNINPWILVGGAAAIYFLTRPASAPGTVPSTGITSIIPGLNNVIPGSGATSAANVGVNSGVKGGNGSFYTVANYAALLAANPNLGNPNYQMTDAEAQQYLANYSDLQTGLPTWIGHPDVGGNTVTSLNQAAREHWKYYGCAEKRIYLPLQPPSTAAFIPPPVNNQAKSGGGSSWIGSAISTVGSIALALLGNQSASVPVLNDGEVNVLVTGAAIVKKILPFYLQVAPDLVHSIENNIDAALSQYQN